ncbi:MAG: ROK family protein [Acidobacteriota bacterium]
MSRNFVAAVDVGGHHMRCWIADEQGEVVSRRRCETIREAATAEANLNRIVELVRQSVEAADLALDDLCCTALGVPGVVDPHAGRIHLVPNIPHWDGLPLVQLLAERLPGAVRVDNDVNLAARGEYWRGAARGEEHFVFLALGTGIGGGVFIGGRPYYGKRFSAGEVGYMVLAPNRPEARIGDMGWFESVAGGRALDLKAQEIVERDPGGRLAQTTAGRAARAADLFAAYAAGDEAARRVLEEVFEYLAQAVVNITSLLDPGLIVFGGGISAQGSRLLDPVGERAARYGLPIPPLKVSELGEEAQLQGGLHAALEILGRT